MKRFDGFPSKMLFTAVPEPFFSHLLPVINDIAELKIILTVIHRLYHQKRIPKFITYNELLYDATLMKGLISETASTDRTLNTGLAKAVTQGIFLTMTVKQDNLEDNLYVLNTDSNRKMLDQVKSGEILLPGLKAYSASMMEPEEVTDIYRLYESNIGLLTPMIADELGIALKTYPESWLVDAIKEAARHNRRKWSYISAILERWGSEGKTDGTYRRDIKKADPDKYIKGKYGHMVQR